MTDLDKCRWKQCRLSSLVLYSVEGKSAMCQKHFAMFCRLQDQGKETEARAKAQLRPRKNAVVAAVDPIPDQTEQTE